MYSCVGVSVVPAEMTVVSVTYPTAGVFSNIPLINYLQNLPYTLSISP